MTNTSRGRWADTGIALGFAAAAWLLYYPVLRLGWMYDDAFLLHHLVAARSGWYLFSGAAFRQLGLNLLAPLLFLSLDVDRRLFGIDPHYFYLHHLLATALCTAALYGVLRIWLRRLPAAMGTWIFLIGPVIASLASLLFVRHYIESILLGLLAVAAWTGALRRTGRGAGGMATLSAVLYFAASMAKEIAVPLIVILPLLPEPSGCRQTGLAARLRLILPHGAMLALYMIVRFEILGTLVGGYGFKADRESLPSLAMALPGKILSEIIAGRIGAATVLFLIVLAAGILAVLLLRGLRALFLIGTGLLIALLLVLPVSTQMEPRYAVPAWIVLAVAFAAGCQALEEKKRWLGSAVGLIACVSGLALNRQDWTVRFASAERMSAEDHFVLGMREGDVLRQPLLVDASLLELQWVKQNIFHRAPGGRWFQDDFYLCAHPEPLGRVWGYDSGLHRVVDVTARIPAIRKEYCSSPRASAPLSASFHDSGGVLGWDLGPYREGKYFFLIGDGAARFEMPRISRFQTQHRAPFLLLRVKYESPDGWVTYSPELRVPLGNGQGVRWRR
jgi:hypothetical protein